LGLVLSLEVKLPAIVAFAVVGAFLAVGEDKVPISFDSGKIESGEWLGFLSLNGREGDEDNNNSKKSLHLEFGFKIYCKSS
jgi:hypothetical protein